MIPIKKISNQNYLWERNSFLMEKPTKYFIDSSNQNHVLYIPVKKEVLFIKWVLIKKVILKIEGPTLRVLVQPNYLVLFGIFFLYLMLFLQAIPSNQILEWIWPFLILFSLVFGGILFVVLISVRFDFSKLIKKAKQN